MIPFQVFGNLGNIDIVNVPDIEAMDNIISATKAKDGEFVNIRIRSEDGGQTLIRSANSMHPTPMNR